MADNITAPATGTVFATDDVASVHYPIEKLAHGALDSVTIVSTASGLPIQFDTALSARIPAALVGGRFDVNTGAINGVAPSMGNGVSGTGVQRVTVASDSTGVVGLNTGTNSVGTVGLNTGTNTVGNVGVVPVTSGGQSISSFLSTAAVQSTAIKASAGQIYSMQFFNLNAAARFVRLYNQTTAPAAGDTANIIWRGMIPGNTAGAGFVAEFTSGLTFSTGIGIRVTAAVADNDNTALAANEIMGNVTFK